ncbi:hypothetical protein ABBQ38_002105 [Trebouxia sp. C0009 RCD-2024]
MTTVFRVFSCVLVILLIGVVANASYVRVLHDADFDHATSEGSWLIEFYAPWCSHCKDLESTWDTLADELKGKVNVAKVDGTTERVLLGRFHVEGFPTIFHIQGAETRQFAGHRTLQKLKDFALAGWRAEPALPLWQSPTSAVGRAWGQIQGVPARAQRFYRYLHKDMHYSQMTLLVGLLAVPLMIGLAVICMMDAYMVRQSIPHHSHHQ